MKKWLSRLTKIAFFMFALIAIVITVLFNMGGSSDTLKGAIEEYIMQSSGFAASIQDFQKMTFFPNISIEMSNILLEKPDPKAMKAWAGAESEKPKEEQGKTPPPISFYKPDAAIDYFKISIGFWDVGLGKTRKIRDIHLKNANFRAGSISHKDVMIKTLNIDETPEGQSFLNLEGRWGDEDFIARMDLKRIGSRTNPKYTISEESPFEAYVSNMEITGIVRPRTMGGIHIKDVKVLHRGEKVLKTTFSLVRDIGNIIEAKGNFEIPEHGSNGVFDWQLNPYTDVKLSGSIEAEKINPADFNANSKFSKAWKEWNSIFINPNRKVDDSDNISITVKDFKGQTFKGRADIGENQVVFTEQ